MDIEVIFSQLANFNTSVMNVMKVSYKDTGKSRYNFKTKHFKSEILFCNMLMLNNSLFLLSRPVVYFMPLCRRI